MIFLENMNAATITGNTTISSISSTNTKTIHLIQRALEILLTSPQDPNAKKIWLNHIRKNIRLTIRAIRSGKCSTPGLRSKLTTDLSHLKRLQIILKKSINHSKHKKNNVRSDRLHWEDVNSCFQNRVRTGVIINITHIEPQTFLNDAFFLFKSRIKNILKSIPLIKVNACFGGQFIRKRADEEIVEFKHFNTRNALIDNGTDLTVWFNNNIIDKILNKLEEFQEKDSGWALHKILMLEININKSEIGNGSSFIELPEEIMRKKACVNIKNKDNACFAWSVTAGLIPAKQHVDRTSSYPHYTSILNLKNIEFPMELKHISAFEENNNLSINVYMLELKSTHFDIVPARLTKNKLQNHINLLLIQNKYFTKQRCGDNDNDLEETLDRDEIKYHYCLIKNLSRLVSNQLSKHIHKVFICDRCLNYFSTQSKLDVHITDCSKINNCKINFPKYDYVEFKNFIYKEKVPFIIYADFESILKCVKDDDSKIGNSFKYQKHEVYSAGYYLKCAYEDSLSYFKSYRGLDCMTWFANELECIATFINSKFKNIKVINYNGITELENTSSSLCHICRKQFTVTSQIVQDHCHLTGNFRGYAHQSCNLNYKNSFIVPIVFHNFSGYDSHFMIKDLAKVSKIRVLPINKEKYISFTTYDYSGTNIKFRFIDSFRFMASSLNSLVSYLTKFPNLKSQFLNIHKDQLELLQRKGVFPYDYIDSIEKLNASKLPPIEFFYNKLNDSNISDSDYMHAQRIWDSFQIKNLGEYSDLYLKTDIILLADVFEQFRISCLNTYHLDPSHYYTLPGYTWDCMLKFTDCKLQIIKDVDMLLFVERGIRGGVSQCSNRFSEANNKYLSTYNPYEPSKYILYLDVNNLYGWAMMQPLPYDGFTWVENFDIFDVASISDDSSEGFIFEVDLKYPENLHDLHKDLPLCPDHVTPPNSKFKKLMTTLHIKTKYIIHYRNLKQALLNGVILTKIHRVLKFKQAQWLKPYIELNTTLRMEAKNDFEKNLFKLMNNAVFGKTMENIRKHRIVKLVSKWEGRYGAKNLISSPKFQNRTIFDENLMAIELSKSVLVFNKPLYIGMAILDISKVCVYDFHYKYMIKKFGENQAKLLYTDTDSLIYEIQCNDVYEEVLKSDIHMFDTSDYPTNNKWGIPLSNKKVPGLMKDELNGEIISHFVGLRSKMYAYKFGEECIKKSKGIKLNVVRNKITFNDYLSCLQNKTELRAVQRSIISRAHDVYSIKQTKIALSPHDDKRFLIQNSYGTLPWGHYRILNDDDV